MAMTSRGDPAEEPRARLTSEAFAPLAARFGPFTEMLGAERRHTQSDASRGGEAASTVRLWLHPTHTTVGSALRLVGERLSEPSAELASGVIIVPHVPVALDNVSKYICVQITVDNVQITRR